MNENESFQFLCHVNSLSSLDASHPSKRNATLNQALSAVKEDVTARNLLSSKFGAQIVLQCSSTNSYRRILTIFSAAFIQHFKDIVEDADQEDPLKNPKSKEINSLAKCICQILKNWYSFEVTLQTKKKLSNKFPKINTVAKTIINPLFQKNEPSNSNHLNLLLDSFMSVVKQVDTVKNKGEYAPAISLLQCFISHFSNKSIDFDKDGYRKTMIELFVKRTLTGGKFASAIEINLASYFLHTLTQEEFDKSIVSTIALKLRGNPEAIMETATALISTLKPTSKTNDKFSLLSHLEGDSKILPSTIRLIRSPKSPLRQKASQLLSDLALSSSNLETLPIVFNAVSESLLGSKAGTAFSTPDQREAAYKSVSHISDSLRAKIKTKELKSQDLHFMEDCLSLTLEAIATTQTKEAASNVSAGNAGMQALFSLLMLSFAMKYTFSKGCIATFKYLSKPIVDASGKTSLTSASGLFKYRIGSMLTTVEDDFLESIVDGIFKTDEKLKKGLECIIDNSMKKFQTSAVVPQTDGLIAIYLFLVQCSQKTSWVIPTSIVKLISGDSKNSFLYGTSMLENTSVDSVIGKLLPRCIALFCKLLSKDEDDKYGDKLSIFEKMFPPRILHETASEIFAAKSSGATKALATCIANPPPSLYERNTSSPEETTLLSSLKTILTYTPDGPNTANTIVDALFLKVQEYSLSIEEATTKLNATRESREIFEPTCDNAPLEKYRGKLYSGNHRGYDSCSIRRISNVLSSHVDSSVLGEISLLMLVGTSKKDSGIQRKGLNDKIAQLIQDIVLSREDVEDKVALESLATFIISCTTKPRNDENKGNNSAVSLSIYETALSFIVSLGMLGGNFDPEFDDPEDEDLVSFAFARFLCVDHIAPQLAKSLTQCTKSIHALTADDIDLFRSREGVLFDGMNGENVSKETPKIGQNAEKKRSVKSRKQKGDFGAGFEDEEWERQVKKELAAKKQSQEPANSRILTAEEQKLLENQSSKRKELSQIITVDFCRSLRTIQSLLVSDIEVGNACLPSLAESIVSSVVSRSPAFEVLPSLRVESFETLRILSSCVFEIDEIFAYELAQSIQISYRKKGKDESDLSKKRLEDDSNDEQSLQVSALPSPCPSAAAIISELDEYNECLSGSSFAFIFPLLRAALTGPRTSPGCESALTILHRHTPLIAGEDADPSVAPLRREMALTVLELLSHDRAQTFSDPTPVEVLCACYELNENEGVSGTLLSPGEMAPLLGENGALAGNNCRTASMIALGSIALKQPTLIKNNPLIENRIWINCFDEDKNVKQAARQTWQYANGRTDQSDSEDPEIPSPSQIYSIPLLPLLDHTNIKIASSAASAFAHAMGRHPVTVEKNLLRLCDTYIEAFPTVFEDAKPKPASNPPKVLPKPKKFVKKTVKSSALKIGAPKIGKGTSRKTKSSINIPKSKAREIDKSVLESQFVSESSKSDPGKDSLEKMNVRLGVLRVITALTDSSTNVFLELSVLKVLVSFLMAYGLADSDETVRNTARNAARDVVSTFGDTEEAIGFLLPYFEAVLNSGKSDENNLGNLSKEKVLRTTLASDRRKEGAVVCLGSAAIHLKGEENLDKIDTTIDMLIATLRTPSEDVQSSVALCLSKLMKKGRTPQRIGAILTKLMLDCLNGDSLAVRRGSAYGISAVVKGSGISSLKKFEIISQLDDACKSNATSGKEGALFTIELLSSRLGLLFEPYVIVLLPALLKAFSDSSDHVRLAAASTVDLIMSKLSAHGVKLVMPAVLTAFGEPAWRTKQASIHMLGSMSNCAPKQLANCLPKVVPKLTEAFSDTHPKVKASAEDALKQICKVIKNPEISSISPVLLKALTDPANETISALEALIETEFLHAIDSPSLALLIPVLHRGLRDRTAKTKRYGALISGNICTMINDPRDFIPYLPTLLPDLKAVLLDPIPDVRSTASKALGSLTRGLGEESLPELRPWLIETLRGDTGTSVERSGAAQGLTEVLIAGGAKLVEDVMHEEILPLRSHPKASTREGVLWVLTFMPSSLGHAFTPLIDVSLPALLSGLSDDNEQIREVALRAGRVLIRSHGKAHVYKILPSLENGLIDDDWRIRVSSLTLLGDLLSLIGGTKIVKGDTETQDDIRQAERAQAQIALALGSDTRKRILSGVYFARSDIAAVVRQSAVQVWKTVVSVTARTLREILDVLVGKIVKALASGNPEQTQVAGRCLGDVVRKLGDTVLPEIIPVLKDELTHGDQNTRRGACIGLTEVIDSSSKEQLDKFLNILLKAVQEALGDEDDDVRKMAASCFQSLHNVVGSRASDEVVPSLLAAMETSYDEASRHRALNGLTGILSIRSRELLPYLIHRLTSKPISKNNADALAAIATVTGSTLHPFFRTIIPSLLIEIEAGNSGDDDDRIQSIRDCARSIFSNVDATSVDWLVGEIASKCSYDKEGIRKESCWMIGAFVEERKEKQDFFEQIPTMYRELLYRLNDGVAHVVKAANVALMTLSKCVSADELVLHIEFCRNLVASIVSEARRRKGGVGDGEFLLPGFNMPKGLEPLLPMYQRGILYGDANIREVAAAGLGELIAITSNKYLAGPFIIKLTGPLLRVVGDRNPSAVKIAIVQTLGLILTKGGLSLRAFVPQFQTTFVKALSDPSRKVRVEAINALALLMPLSTRLDPLIKELVSGSLGGGAAASIEAAGAIAVQTATLDALACVLNHGGKKAKLPDSIPSALNAGKDLLSHEDEGIREGASKVIGAACGVLGVETAVEVIQDLILDHSTNDLNDVKHGKACASRYIFASSCGKQVDRAICDQVVNLVIDLMDDHNNRVKEAASVAAGALLGSHQDEAKCLQIVQPMLLKNMKPAEDIELHKSVAKGLCLCVSLNSDVFDGEKGLPIINASLKLAMSGTQKVQYAYNEFLWLAMSIGDGESVNKLDEYYEISNFENARTMKNLATKVLSRIKSVALEQ